MTTEGQQPTIKQRTADNIVLRRAEDLERLPVLVEELRGKPIEEIARIVRTHERREERLERWLGMDQKTGLPGSKIFKSNTEIQMAEVDKAPGQKGVRLAFADLDDFGIVNKLHGEQIGDAVLRDVGQALNRAGREATDLPCRWGGEEFTMLIPFIIDTTRVSGKEARHPGEHIRQAIAAVNVPIKDNLPLTVTATVGIATYQPGETFESFFDRADRAMRVAKLLGKNRTVEAIIISGKEEMRDITENKTYRLGTHTSGEELLTCVTDDRHWLIKTNENHKRYLEPLSQ